MLTLFHAHVSTSTIHLKKFNKNKKAGIKIRRWQKKHIYTWVRKSLARITISHANKIILK